MLLNVCVGINKLTHLAARMMATAAPLYISSGGFDVTFVNRSLRLFGRPYAVSGDRDSAFCIVSDTCTEDKRQQKISWKLGKFIW